ncbi:MAG: hypothetical protein LLG02_08790 [Pelosinus sp.]|nr:hypothetical protein [Pelosinus sp.]
MKLIGDVVNKYTLLKFIAAILFFFVFKYVIQAIFSSKLEFYINNY